MGNWGIDAQVPHEDEEEEAIDIDTLYKEEKEEETNLRNQWRIIEQVRTTVTYQ